MVNFKKYPNITSITIPNNVQLTTKSMAYKFQGTSLEQMIVPESITSISGAFYSSYKYKTPVVSNTMKDISGAFRYSGINVTEAVCGPNVTNMRGAYRHCSSLTTAVCGPNVLDLHDTYNNCTNLIHAVCGDKVTDMGYAYAHCSNLKTAVCGPNVVNFSHAFASSPVNGVAVCGDKVVDMSSSYSNTYVSEAICGPNVTNMHRTYANCRFIDVPVCGEKVTDFSYTYFNALHLTGDFVCGPNVTNMAYAYKHSQTSTSYLNDYQTQAVCGPNVIDMSQAYTNCLGIITPACGSKVTNLSSTYAGCNKIIEAVCGEAVINMQSAYSGCTNLTTAACGNKVKDLTSAYFNCASLTEAVCGPEVELLSGTYQNCANLVKAVCGDKVVDMRSAYYGCTSLESAVCGPNVIDMRAAYANCTNLKTGVCGENVTNMASAYEQCISLVSGEIGPKVTNTTNVFYNCISLTDVKIHNGVKTLGANVFRSCTALTSLTIPASVDTFYTNVIYNCRNIASIKFEGYRNSVPTLPSGVFNNISNNCQFIVPASMYNSWYNTSAWANYRSRLVADTALEVIENLEDSLLMDFESSPRKFTVDLYNLSSEATIECSSTDETISTITQLLETAEDGHSQLTLEIQQHQKIGTAEINVSIKSVDSTWQKQINIEVQEMVPASFEASIFSMHTDALTGHNTFRGLYSMVDYYDGNYVIHKIDINNPSSKEVIITCGLSLDKKSNSYSTAADTLVTFSKVDTPFEASSYDSKEADKTYQKIAVCPGDAVPEKTQISYGNLNSGSIYIKHKATYNFSTTLTLKVSFE